MKEKIHSSPFENFEKKEKSPPRKDYNPYPKKNINNLPETNKPPNNNQNLSNIPKENQINNKNINKNNDMYILQRKQNMIDPESIPHPSEFEDYYLNNNNDNLKIIKIFIY